MKAAVLTAPGKIEIKDAPKPEPTDSQMRIRVEGCGICASSIPLWEGREWFSYPRSSGEPGHEGWGYVDKVGSKITRFKAGDRVAFLSGASFAEYDLTDEISAIRLPHILHDQAFPAEPLGCAMNIFKRSKIKAGQTVAIMGIGFLGAMLVQLAKNAGAKVIALSQREHSLSVARANGADETIALNDHYAIISKVKELTDNHFCDRVIECTGKEWPLNLAGELTAERGMLIIAGYHQDGLRSVNVQLWNWRGLDVINAHERDPKQYIRGMRAAVKAIQDGRLKPHTLLTHSYRLEEIEKAFNDVCTRPGNFMKAIIQMA